MFETSARNVLLCSKKCFVFQRNCIVLFFCLSYYLLRKMIMDLLFAFLKLFANANEASVYF